MAILETDRLDLRLTDDGDLYVDSAGTQWVSGLTGVVQLCRLAILQFRGEWFADLDKGVSWYQEILGAKPASAIARIRTEMREALLEVPGVLDVTELEVEYTGQDRSLAVTWRVSTVFGDTNVETVTV